MMDKDLTLDDLTREELIRLIRKSGFLFQPSQKAFVWAKHEVARDKARVLLDKTDDSFNARCRAFDAWVAASKAPVDFPRLDTLWKASRDADAIHYQAEADYRRAQKRADRLFNRWSVLAKVGKSS